jgi:hypothetical protein
LSAASSLRVACGESDHPEGGLTRCFTNKDPGEILPAKDIRQDRDEAIQMMTAEDETANQTIGPTSINLGVSLATIRSNDQIRALDDSVMCAIYNFRKRFARTICAELFVQKFSGHLGVARRGNETPGHIRNIDCTIAVVQ